MRSSNYGALDTRVESGSRSGYAESCRRSLRVVNETEEASAREPLVQNRTTSLPTDIFSDGDETPRTKVKRMKKRRFRKRKQRPGETSKEERKRFSSMKFVAPPYVFPAWDEMSATQQEDEEHRRSSVGKSLAKLPEDEGNDLDGSTGGKEKVPLPPLTKRQIFTIIMLATVNFCSTVVVSCIAPFFPAEVCFQPCYIGGCSTISRGVRGRADYIYVEHISTLSTNNVVYLFFNPEKLGPLISTFLGICDVCTPFGTEAPSN